MEEKFGSCLQTILHHIKKIALRIKPYSLYPNGDDKSMRQFRCVYIERGHDQTRHGRWQVAVAKAATAAAAVA